MARRLAGAGSGALSGERDLTALLRTMAPQLHPARYSFSVAASGDSFPDNAFALIREAEGTTVIAEAPDGEWARITLTVHSSLDAIGLTAAVAHALTETGISANVVAGFYHDHIFVPWARRHEAVAALERLGQGEVS